jgi:hypothetical protein
LKPDNLIHQHQMVLYNFNISVEWIFQNDKPHVTAVTFHVCGTQDLKRFMSGNVFKLIVEDIEKYELKQKWM